MKINIFRTGLLSLTLFTFALILLFAVPSAQVNSFAQEDGGNKSIISATISAGASEAEGPVLTLALPAPAEVGELITITLLVDDAANLAGFQTTLTYDAEGLKYATAAPAEAFGGSGREVLPLGPVRKEGAVVLGGATCPVADCDAILYQQARSAATTTSEAVELATFSFFIREPGTHQIHLGETLLVDSAGNSLLATPSFLESTAQNPEPAVIDLDVTGNNVVNDSDAWMLVSSWYDLQQEDRCGSIVLDKYDVDANGCINVADVQKVLAAWGESPNPDLASSLLERANTLAATLVVNSAGDEGDANKGDGVCRTSSGVCTLRAALEEANTYPGEEIIQFNIRNGDGSCPSRVIIQLNSSLQLDAADNKSITIDGYSQCGAVANTNPVHGNADIRIEIKGNKTRDVHCLIVNSNNSLVKGLAIYDCHRQILLSGAHNNRIEGNFLGTNAANTHKTGIARAEVEGIRIQYSSYNTVGGTTPQARNIVAGNNLDGIGLDTQARNTYVLGNFVGLKQDGVTALPNVADGIDIAAGSYNNVIGGLNPGERNVVSGNLRDGIEISHDITNQFNHVVGNFVGLNATGTGPLRNGQNGVSFEDSVNQNHVYRNVIVDNGANGARFYTVYNNHLYANFIGVYPKGISPNQVVPHPASVNPADLVPLPNGQNPDANKQLGLSGIFILGGSHHNLVQDNIIAYHPEYGIYLSTQPGYLADDLDWTCETHYNTFSKNRIYNNEQKGIRLKTGSCQGTTYTPNKGIAAPGIETATTTSVSGTTCSNCRIEIFVADKTSVNDSAGDNHGEGKIFSGEGTAGQDGRFTVSISSVAEGQLVTATVTDADGNTSEFGRNVLVTAAPPPAEEGNELFLPLIRRN